MGFLETLGRGGQYIASKVMGGLAGPMQAAGLTAKQDGPLGSGAYTAPGQAYGYGDKVQTSAGAPMGQSDQSRGFLASLVGKLQGQADGTAPSMAGLQLQQGNEQQQKNFLGALAAQRGMNPGAVATLAAGQAAQGGQATNMAAAQAAIAERNAAQNLLGQVGGQIREGDLSAAGLTQGNNQFNTTSANQAAAAQALAANQLAAGQNQQISDIEKQRQQANWQLRNQFLQDLTKGATEAASKLATGGAV